jgi:hypothetical protein
MSPLRADGGDDVNVGSTRLLVYRHESDHFGFDMFLNTSCSRFLMFDLDAILFGFVI